MSSITLHKQFGLNPSLCVCFYCGEETGEIALLGAKCKGEAPRHTCITIEPCAKCKEKFKHQVLLVEATQENGKPSPTGRWLAVPKNSINIQTPKGVAFITEETFIELTRQRG